MLEDVSKQGVVTTFHRSGQNEPSKSFELFEGFVNRPEHGTVVTTAKTTVPCPFASMSLSDDGMLFLLCRFKFETASCLARVEFRKFLYFSAINSSI